MRVSDRIFGVVGLALAAFFAWAASWIEDSFIVDPVGPRKFPYIIAGVMVLASLAVILRPDDEPEWPALGAPAGLLAAIAGFALLGFGLPALVGLAGLQPQAQELVQAVCLLAAPILGVLAARGFGPVSPATEVLMAVGAMIAYALALPPLGFLPATAIASSYIGWRLGSTPPWALLAGLITALSIYIIFHKILGLSLAKGPVGPWVDAVIDPIGRVVAWLWQPLQAAIDWLRGLVGGGAGVPVPEVPTLAPGAGN